MTTDWNFLSRCFQAKPFFYTDNMKDCFIYDNPYGFSILELAQIFHTTSDEIVKRYDDGLSKYKFVRKGGRFGKC